MKVELTTAAWHSDMRFPKGEVFTVKETHTRLYQVTEGEYTGLAISKAICKPVVEIKTYTEKEYNHIMHLLDKEREKTDRLEQAVHKLINIIYKKTFPGVID